jgi:iron complex transport system ATP-binding protein
MVTHHVEEIPEGFTHVLLLHAGSALITGPISSSLTATVLSECFGLPLELRHDAGRWTSRSARTP